jgi:hypothetical protein
MFQHTSRDMPFVELATAIQNGTAIAISDGSHKNNWGAEAWRLLSSNADKRHWRGLHVTPVRKGDHSAFRSELGGIYTMLVTITLVCEFLDIDQRSVEIGSDCESALYYIFTKDEFIPATTNSFDIIMAAIKVLARLQFQHKHRHIPAHQSITCHEIDTWGQEMMTATQKQKRSGGMKKTKRRRWSR